MISREQVEAVRLWSAKDFVSHFKGKEVPPGWPLMFMHGVEKMQMGMANILVASEATADALVELAETNPLAFDAAGYLASHSIVAELPLPLSLRAFAAKVLAGEITRPSQRGRPSGRDAIIKALQFGLVEFVDGASDVDMPLGRNEASPAGGNAPLCIFDAVANAFTEAGYRTTYEDIRSIYYAKNYEDIRKLGRWSCAWRTNEKHLRFWGNQGVE